MRKVIKKINYCSQFIASAALAVLMFMTVVDVIVRKFLGFYMPGSYELTMQLLTFIVLFGVAYANDFKEHVVIDFVYDMLPRLGKKAFSIICSIVNLAIIGLMCFFVFKYGIDLIARGAVTSTLRIPLWPVVLCGGIGLLGFVLSIIGDLIFVIVEGGVLSNDPS